MHGVSATVLPGTLQCHRTRAVDTPVLDVLTNRAYNVVVTQYNDWADAAGMRPGKGSSRDTEPTTIPRPEHVGPNTKFH